jgi:DNA invertase Pin-like site-specific DNA recombinase
MAAREPSASVRIVELLRVSGQGQADRDTPADQRAALDKLREMFPGVLVERIDSGAVRAVSGAADLNARPDLQRLAVLAKARSFDELRVRHLDRLTRHTDPRERFAIYGMVQEAGAVIRDASGHVIDPATEIGEVDYFLQTWMAAKERRRIAERTLAARKRLSAQGVPQTTIPYGRTYDRKHGTWGIEETEAEVYRSLFAGILSGKSLRSIAQALNERGIPAPRGGTWRPDGIRQMVTNPSAVGKLTSYRHAIPCPAIVDEETQQRVKDVLRKGRSRSGPGTTHDALLRKIARCGVCGSAMHVAVGGQKRILYYVCAQHRRPGHDKDCGVFHSVESKDAAIREKLRPVLSDPETLVHNLQHPAKGAGTGDNLNEIRADLDDLAKREEKLVRLASKGMMSDAIYERQAGEIARLRESATARLSIAQAQVEASARASARVHEVEAALRDARKDIAEDDFKGWRKVVALLFAGEGCSVRVMPDGEVQMDGLLPVVHPSSGTTSISSSPTRSRASRTSSGIWARSSPAQ